MVSPRARAGSLSIGALIALPLRGFRLWHLVSWETGCPGFSGPVPSTRLDKGGTQALPDGHGTSERGLGEGSRLTRSTGGMVASRVRRLRAMERDHFRELVREALASLPQDLMARVQNVEVVIEWRPTAHDRRAAGLGPGRTLLGLYHGIPLPHRSEGYNLVLPDKISIYQGPIESICANDDEVREQVRTTVLHEIGHYFGIDDERLHELGMG